MSQNKPIDYAILITLSIGYLYLVGWSYWKSYYEYFGISGSTIELPFIQMIVSAWLGLIMLFAFLFMVIDTSRGRINRLSDIKINIPYLILFGLIICALFMYSYISNVWIRLGILLLFSLIFGISNAIYGDVNFHLGKNLKDKHGKFFFTVTFVFISILVSTLYAKSVAQNVAKGTIGSKIKIELRNSSQKFEDYVFIANMGGKYFICKEVDQIEQPKTIIINESDVSVASIIR